MKSKSTSIIVPLDPNVKLSPRFINLTGQRFGKLVVVECLGKRNKAQIIWKCQCDCGNFSRSATQSLRNGMAKSCGCVRIELVRQIGLRVDHGHTRRGRVSREYCAWQAMKARCTNPNQSSYKNYGGKGILICARWLNSFENFFEDMGRKPSPIHSLGRIKNKLGYFKENCRWETGKQQANNRSSSRFIDFKGKSMTAKQWSEELEIPIATIYQRLGKGWSTERAFTTPLYANRLTNVESLV